MMCLMIKEEYMFKDCEFEGRCENEDIDCEFCQYNAYACTQDLFEWNGEGEEPTQEELNNAVHNQEECNEENKNGIRDIFVTNKYRLTNKRGTFCLTNLDSGKMYFLQFSTKDPWWIPKSELIHNTIKLYGWLFFYVGYAVK